MKKANLNEEIEISQIINFIWKEKLMICLVTTILAILFNIYFTNKNFKSEYSTEITIKKPPTELFVDYHMIDKVNNEKLIFEFYKEFITNINSYDILQNYVDKHENINEFKKFLIDKNISAKEYFKTRFKRANKAAIRENFKDEYIDENAKYFFKFDISLKGDDFLNDYIEFVQEYTSEQFYYKINKILISQIATYNLNINIAKSIEKENPDMFNLMNNSMISRYNADSRVITYLKGSKVLTYERDYLDMILSSLKPNKFDFDPILDNASIPKKIIDPNKRLYPLFGLFIGFLISLFIAYIKKSRTIKKR